MPLPSIARWSAVARKAVNPKTKTKNINVPNGSNDAKSAQRNFGKNNVDVKV